MEHSASMAPHTPSLTDWQLVTRVTLHFTLGKKTMINHDVHKVDSSWCFCFSSCESGAHESDLNTFVVDQEEWRGGLHVPWVHVPWSRGMQVHAFCAVLYCSVLYCSVLYCAVLFCTVLYCTVLYCTVLYCTVLYCTVLFCTVLCWSCTELKRLYCVSWSTALKAIYVHMHPLLTNPNRHLLHFSTLPWRMRSSPWCCIVKPTESSSLHGSVYACDGHSCIPWLVYQYN